MKSVVASRTGNTEKIVLTILITVCSFLHGCKKTVCPLEPPPPEEPKTKVGKLKEIVAQNLPNPMYHFDYTDSGITTDINFASGFFIYRLNYVNGRLDRMINSFNNNAMVYTYSNGRVTSIRDMTPDGRLLWNYSFDYSTGNQLKEVRWYRFNNAGTDSFLLRKVILEFRTDGNLAWFEDYRNTTGVLEWEQKIEYTNYDKERNVDDFSVLKEFFDNLLYLPGVRLQKNNPGSELITSTQNTYEITNTWQYQNGRPIQKMAKVVQVRGNDVGDLGDYSTNYSYY
jgi:hypothetical protein